MSLGIDPKVDFAFKLVFGSPDHTAVTIHFLNAILDLATPITWVEILNPIQDKDRSEDKLVILDVLAKDAEGRRLNIEMQTTLPMDLPKRLTYYNSLNYVRQLRDGESYHLLRPAISVCVLDRVLFGQVSDFHLSFRLRSDQHDLVFSNDLEFHVLELPKFNVSSDNIRGRPAQDKWLYFLRHAEEMDATELASLLSEAAYREAIEVLEMISRSPEDRQFYEARMKFLHDEESRLIAARLEGEARGEVKGRIKLLRELLQLDPIVLDNLTMEALVAMEHELQSQLRNRDLG